MHVYTNKNYVLRTLKQKLDEKGDIKYLDILVFNKKGSHEASKPESYEELEELLKDTDKVYSFDKVETQLHGAIGYDIIING